MNARTGFLPCTSGEAERRSIEAEAESKMVTLREVGTWNVEREGVLSLTEKIVDRLSERSRNCQVKPGDQHK